MVVQSSPSLVRIASIAAGLLGCIHSAGAQSVSLRSSMADPRAGFSVVFTASPEAVASLQFDLEYDSTRAALFPSPGLAARSSNKMLAIHDLSTDRKRLIVYGLNATGIAGGSLTDIAVSPRGQASAAIRIVDVRAVYGNGVAAPVDVQAGSLTMSPDTSLMLTSAGIWNAASGQPAPVSGGEIMTLRGAGLGPEVGTLPAAGPVASSLGGVRVAFDGIPAPLLYAGPDQINLIAPWAITNRAATQITVTRNSIPIAGISAPVAERTPEIFTLSATGAGAAAVINQDGTVNSPLNPARAGSVIEIYGTGLGPLRPRGIDGAIAGVSHAEAQVSVTIDGRPAEVTYAGSAPALVSGAFQVNCRIPQGIGVNPAVEVRVRAGDAVSAAGVTIAVR